MNTEKTTAQLSNAARTELLLKVCDGMTKSADLMRSSGDGYAAILVMRSVLPLALRELFLRYSPKATTERSPGELLHILRSHGHIDAETHDQVRAAAGGLGDWGQPADARKMIAAARRLLTLADREETPDQRPSDQSAEIKTMMADLLRMLGGPTDGE